MARGFNWTKIAKQDQMRRNGTRDVEALTKKWLKRLKRSRKKVKRKMIKTTSGRVRSGPKTPIVFVWDPPRSAE